MFHKTAVGRFIIIFLCLVLGTWLGIFFQQFGPTAKYFKNFIDFAFNINEISLVFVKFGLLFGMKINLGTILGGIVGLWITR